MTEHNPQLRNEYILQFISLNMPPAIWESKKVIQNAQTFRPKRQPNLHQYITLHKPTSHTAKIKENSPAAQQKHLPAGQRESKKWVGYGETEGV